MYETKGDAVERFMKGLARKSKVKRYQVSYTGTKFQQIMGTTELKIPYDCVFDKIPTPCPPGITFTFEEPSAMALEIFHDLE